MGLTTHCANGTIKRRFRASGLCTKQAIHLGRQADAASWKQQLLQLNRRRDGCCRWVHGEQADVDRGILAVAIWCHAALSTAGRCIDS